MAAEPMTPLSFTIRPEHAADGAAIERLHARAFGPGRFARTAFRLRERADRDGAEDAGDRNAPCGFTAHTGTFLAGSVRWMPVLAGGIQAVMLGPLTVDPAFGGRGIGAALMQEAIANAMSGDSPLMLLVGDKGYYGRFGFETVPPGHLSLPGPVDPARFLGLELLEGSLAMAIGPVTPIRRG